MTVHRKVARLPPENYVGRQIYFVTICCDHRATHLHEQPTAQLVLSLLHECAVSHSYRLHAYCLMPDHLHILVEGAHESAWVGAWTESLQSQNADQGASPSKRTSRRSKEPSR